MNKYWFYKVGLVVVFLCFALLGEAKVKLPTLVSDGMVLQRGEPVNIWGTADPDETVSITFQKKKYKTVADAQGNWKVILPALKAGGPYTIEEFLYSVQSDNHCPQISHPENGL